MINLGIRFAFTPGSFRETAKDKCNLKRLGITHVLNAAEGTWNNVDTGAGYYSDMDVVYRGVVAEDIPTFDLSQHFYPAARFIEETLSNPQSKMTLKQVKYLLSAIHQTLRSTLVAWVSLFTRCKLSFQLT